MKNLTLYILVLLAALLSACNPYASILAPLQYIPANCHCRYTSMAIHYYNCQISELQQQGYPHEQAIDSATLRTHRLIAETQLHLFKNPEKQRRFCDCYQVTNPNNYATPQ